MQISPEIKAALTLAGNQDDTDIDIGETALTLAAAKLPIKTRFVERIAE